MASTKNMKTLIQALCCFALIFTPVYAFWIPRPIEQRIVDSDCIAVATFEDFETTSKSEAFEDQKARFTLVRTIKGTLEQTFFVHGAKTTMCAPFVDFSSVKKGTYLVFLTSADTNGLRFPLDASVIEVGDGKLLWTEPKETTPHTRTLQYVERSILSIAKSSPSQRKKSRS